MKKLSAYKFRYFKCTTDMKQVRPLHSLKTLSQYIPIFDTVKLFLPFYQNCNYYSPNRMCNGLWQSCKCFAWFVCFHLLLICLCVYLNCYSNEDSLKWKNQTYPRRVPVFSDCTQGQSRTQGKSFHFLYRAWYPDILTRPTLWMWKNK